MRALFGALGTLGQLSMSTAATRGAYELFPGQVVRSLTGLTCSLVVLQLEFGTPLTNRVDPFPLWKDRKEKCLSFLPIKKFHRFWHASADPMCVESRLIPSDGCLFGFQSLLKSSIHPIHNSLGSAKRTDFVPHTTFRLRPLGARVTAHSCATAVRHDGQRHRFNSTSLGICSMKSFKMFDQLGEPEDLGSGFVAQSSSFRFASRSCAMRWTLVAEPLSRDWTWSPKSEDEQGR